MSDMELTAEETKKTKRKEYTKRYLKKNKEKIKERNKQFRKNIIEDKSNYKIEPIKQVEILISDDMTTKEKYNILNTEKLKEYRRQYYQKNKEKMDEINKKYRKENKEKMKNNMHVFPGLTANQTRAALSTWAQAVKKRDNNCCTSCSSTKELHAHHILSKKLHPELMLHISNGTTLCKNCHYDVHHS